MGEEEENELATATEGVTRGYQREKDLQQINQLRNALKRENPASRSLSMCLTKLDEAYLWLLNAEEFAGRKV